MKTFFTTLILFLFTVTAFPQIEFGDVLLEHSVYSEAPEEIQNTEAFIHERWFYEQRLYPFEQIPVNAYSNAIEQRNLLREQNSDIMPNINWVSLGPTPGYYFAYGNIASRVVTGAFNPVNPNIIYIGPANGGVWKSTDGGVNWFPLTDNEASMSMGAIAIDPSNPSIIYAGTGEATYSGASYYGRGLLKSTDAGMTWTQITNGLPSSTYFSRLKIRPNHSNELFAALGNSGFYKSTDSGISWVGIYGGRCDDVIFTASGDTAFIIGSGVGLRRSVDGGATFNTFGTGLPNGNRTHFDLCKTNPAFMYAAVYSGSSVVAYKSSDYGANWSSLSYSFSNAGQAWYDLHCEVNPWNPNNVYIGLVDVYRSTNGGSSFSNITNSYSGGTVHPDQHYLFFHPTDQNTFFITNDGGVWKTTNNGNNFTNLNQTLTLTQFYRIAASPFDPGRIMGGTQDNGTQQTFSTLNWAAAFGGDGGEVCFNPQVANDQNIIGETQNNGLVRTTNGGTTWVNATSGISGSENAAWVGPIIKDPNVSSWFFTARQRVYKTTDYGASWNAVSGNVNGSNAVRELTQSKTNSSIMFAASGSQLFRSTDSGVNWSNVSTGLPNRTITSVYISPVDENLVFLTFSGFSTAKVYKSTNQGSSWFSINGNLPDSPVNDIFVYTADTTHANTYFVATDVGVFLTSDNGTNWVELQNGLPNTVIMHLDYSPSNQMLRAGTHGRGVYEAFIDLVVPVELTSFTAEKGNNNVKLNWSTATETNNHGFEIERKLKNQEWQTLGFIEGSGTTTQPNNYSYVDDYSLLPYEGTVLYRLKQIDYNGRFQYSEQVAVNITFVPGEYYISQNYPNPFNPSTTIKYSLPVESLVRIRIYNSIGEVIEELVNGMQERGNYETSWNAEDYSSGIYFYSFELSGEDGQTHSEMKKIVFMK